MVRAVVPLLLTVALTAGPSAPTPPLRWVVFYGAEADPVAFAPYDLVVLDGDRHPPLGPLIERGKQVLGYLALCEVAEHRSYFEDVKAEGLLLGEHPTWRGSHYVDVRDPRWTRRVIEDLVPRLLRRGFTGLFLDTLDDAAMLEARPGGRGTRQAAVRLVRTIRRQYPGVMIMMNRGYDLLADVERHVDAVLAESLFGTYDFDRRRYHRVGAADTARQIALLQAARARHPALRLFSLDYWDPDDEDGVAVLYREARAAGFASYVATIDLDRIVHEPR